MSVTPDIGHTAPKNVCSEAPAQDSLKRSAKAVLSGSALPPQSAAYPAMPPVGSQRTGAELASTDVVSPPPCTSGCEQHVAPSESPRSVDTVIAGRQGSASGTIAVPSGQTSIPWPAVPGAPPGYPGDCHTGSWNDGDLLFGSSFSIPLSELEQRAPCFTDIRYMGCWLAARYSPYNGWSCSATPIQRIHGQVSIKSRRPGLWQQWQQQQTPAVPAGLWADPARVWPAALWATTVWRNPTVWQPVYAKRRICTSSTVPAAAVSHPVQQWAGPPSRCTLQLWGWPYAPWSGMQGSFFCMSYSC